MTAPPSNSKIGTFIRANEMPIEEPVNGLIYGPSKAGKTWLLATAGDRTLLVDTGEGMATIQSKDFREKVKANPLVVKVREVIPDGKIFPAVADAYDSVSETIDYALDNFSNDFDTICIDDMTGMNKFALYKALEGLQVLGKSKSKTRSEQIGMLDVAIQDRGGEMALIQQFCDYWIHAARKAGKNLFITAHERVTLVKPRGPDGNVVIGEPGNIKQIRPAVTGSTFPDTITALFDNVWHMEVIGSGDRMIHRLRIYGDDIIAAGTRHGGIWGTLIVNPNLAEMLRQIKESRKS